MVIHAPLKTLKAGERTPTMAKETVVKYIAAARHCRQWYTICMHIVHERRKKLLRKLKETERKIFVVSIRDAAATYAIIHTVNLMGRKSTYIFRENTCQSS